MREDVIPFAHTGGNLPFAVSLCGISYCDGTYSIVRRKSDVCCVEYIYKGEGTVNINNISFCAKEGDVYILPQGYDQVYGSDDKNPWVKIWFNIKGPLIDRLTECYGISHVYHIENLDLHLLFEEFLDIARSELTQDKKTDKCAGIFLQVVQAIAGRVNPAAGKKTSDVAVSLKTVLDEVTDFSVDFDTLISRIYCTKSHAIRAFRNAYGITPYKYLLKRKIAAASTMLCNTAMTISRISDFMGFRDSHYFSNFFKKHTGMSPKEYRNSKNCI